jgi:hypothetical protein
VRAPLLVAGVCACGVLGVPLLVAGVCACGVLGVPLLVAGVCACDVLGVPSSVVGAAPIICCTYRYMSLELSLGWLQQSCAHRYLS